MTLWSHYVYNRQGRCLMGLEMPESSTPEEVVAEYLKQSGGTLAFPVRFEDDSLSALGERYAWFGERKGGKEFNRYAVVASMGEWPS